MKNLKTGIKKLFLELRELAKRRRQRNFPDLQGKMQFPEGYDYEAMRKGL